MPDHRLATVTAADPATGICTVTDDSAASYDAKALGWLPVVGQTVWVEKRGQHQSDWVITDLHDVPVVQEINGRFIQGIVSAVDVTSLTAVDVITYSPAINVPGWAQDGTHFLWVKAITNPAVITGAWAGNVRLGVGAGLANEGTVAIVGVQAPGATVQFTQVVTGTFTIAAAATTISPKVQAYRASGAGALRFVTSLIWEWTIY